MNRFLWLFAGCAGGLFAQNDYVRPVSWKELAPNILSDQKQIWTYPARAFRRKNIVPTLAVVGTTAALLLVDPKEGEFFHNSSSFHGFNQAFSGTNTSLAMIAVPVSLYAAGLIRKDGKLQRTALWAGEAVADSEILTTVFKEVDRRKRPSSFGPGANYWDAWLDAKGSGGFPSGHTIAAFSIATVVARQYGTNHRWIPYAAYGAAALIGFSRLTLSAHFVGDVFAGGVFGYAVARFGVLRY